MTSYTFDYEDMTDEDRTVCGDPVVAVNGKVANETEKAVLFLRGKKQVWLSKSIVYNEGHVDTSRRDVIDIPMRIAYQNKLPVSYNPVTSKGKEHNQKLRFENYLTIPCFDKQKKAKSEVTITSGGQKTKGRDQKRLDSIEGIRSQNVVTLNGVEHMTVSHFFHAANAEAPPASYIVIGQMASRIHRERFGNPPPKTTIIVQSNGVYYERMYNAYPKWIIEQAVKDVIEKGCHEG